MSIQCLSSELFTLHLLSFDLFDPYLFEMKYTYFQKCIFKWRILDMYTFMYIFASIFSLSSPNWLHLTCSLFLTYLSHVQFMLDSVGILLSCSSEYIKSTLLLKLWFLIAKTSSIYLFVSLEDTAFFLECPFTVSGLILFHMNIKINFPIN
jgi:hypothetical protein